MGSRQRAVGAVANGQQRWSELLPSGTCSAWVGAGMVPSGSRAWWGLLPSGSSVRWELQPRRGIDYCGHEPYVVREQHCDVPGAAH